jgi:hypothetical protein
MTDLERIEQETEYTRQGMVSLGGAIHLSREACGRLDVEDCNKPSHEMLDACAGMLQRAADAARDAALMFRLGARPTAGATTESHENEGTDTRERPGASPDVLTGGTTYGRSTRSSTRRPHAKETRSDHWRAAPDQGRARVVPQPGHFGPRLPSTRMGIYILAATCTRPRSAT